MKVNIRFLAILLVGLALLGGGVHFLHGYQVKRNAGAFLDLANRAEQEAETADARGNEAHSRKAVQHLRRYLALRPRDTEARARLGMLLEKLARSPKNLTDALLVYETVLRQDPGRKDTRLLAVKLAIRLGRESDALDHLDVLGARESSDGELRTLYGQCLEMQGDYKGARDHYKEAITLKPYTIEAFAGYAALLRQRFNDPKAADDVMKQMAKTITTAKASLVLCNYWTEFDKTKKGKEEAARALAEAQRRDADDAEVLLQSASMAGAEEGPEAEKKARKFLERGIEVHKEDARMYLALASLEEQAGQRSEAVAVVRRGLEALPGQVELLWTLADLLVADGDGAEVVELIDQLKKAGLVPSRLNYLTARLQFARGQWREAADMLEHTRPDLDAWPALVRHTDLILARCYEQLGDLDQQHRAYQRLVASDRLSVAGNLGLGATLEALGREEEALKNYQRLLRTDYAPQVRLRVANLLIRRNQERSEQAWEQVEQLLSEASKTKEEAVEAAIVEARMWVVRDKPEKAEKVLIEVRKQHPKEVSLWIAQATLAEQRRQPEQAIALLDEAERTLGDRIELRLTRASLLVQRQAAKSAPVLAKLAQEIDKFTTPEQERLLRGLAVAHSLAEDQSGAVRLWSRLAELRPNDLGVRIALFDLSLLAKDQEASAQAVEDIRRIEGTGGSLWKYARAALMVEEARAGGPSKLIEARGLLTNVIAKRPSWSRAPLCLAMAEELAGNKELAISRYKQAIELGDHSPSTIRAVVVLLSQKHRFVDAESMLRKLPQQDNLPPDLQKMSAEISLHTRTNPEHTISLAQQAVKADSNDYRDHLWLGQILSQSSAHAEEAEEALRRAIKLGGAEPETWVALVAHLARTGKKTEAEALIPEARAKLPKEKAPLALARCYESVGQRDQARKLYQELLAKEPDNPDALTSIAQFHLRAGELPEAEKYLIKLIQSKARPDDVAWARRTLAVVLHAGGDHQRKRQALAMLNILDDRLDDAAFQEMPAEDVRTRAALLASHWERRRRMEAVRLLEALAVRQPLAPADQFLLGQAYESIGKWKETSRHMSAAVSADSDNIVYLASYINSLLRHNEWDTAAVWLAKLEKKQPATLVTVLLKVNLLHGQHKDDEAAAAVRNYVGSTDADLRRAALLFEMIGKTTESGDLFRKLAGDKKHPEQVLARAAFLGRQGQTAEALELCEHAPAGCGPIDVASTCIQVIYISKEPAAHTERVDRLLQKMAGKEAGRVDFTAHLAALRNLQGKYAESEALYRTLLARDSKNTLALNNLAFLLAMHDGKPAEALALIKRGWDEKGPSLDLSDTRALVLLKMGDTKSALQELEELTGNAPRPVAYFHLAQVHEAAGDRLAARVAFLKTQELKLQLHDLHPLEQESYRQMSQRLGSR